MKNLKYLILLICSICSTTQAQVYEWKGICVLDRTVESYDLTTWLSAKSRSMADYIPIQFNNNILALGVDNSINRYMFINTSGVKKVSNFTIIGFENEEIKASIILYANNGMETPIILYSKGAPPFFIGNCTLSKTK